MYLIGNDTLRRALEKEGVPMAEIQAHIRAVDCLKTAHTRLRDEFAMAAWGDIYVRTCSLLKSQGVTVENIYEISAMASYEAADEMIRIRGLQV